MCDCIGSPRIPGGQSWPGNVREFRAAIDRAVILASSSLLDMETVADALNPALDVADNSASYCELLRICHSHRGQATPIAAELGISRATLFRRLKALGISLGRLRVATSLETY